MLYAALPTLPTMNTFIENSISEELFYFYLFNDFLKSRKDFSISGRKVIWRRITLAILLF